MIKKIAELEAQLNEQAREVANLRAAFATQFKRIEQMQAELDQLPAARRRRRMLEATLHVPPNGNGNSVTLGARYRGWTG